MSYTNRLLTPPPALNADNIRQLQTRSQSEARNLRRLVEDKGSTYSLRDYVLSHSQYKLAEFNAKSVAAVREVSDAAKEQTGHQPWGAWVPLAGLTRDLTVSGSAALVTNTVAPSLQGSLEPHSAVMGGATILTGLNGLAFSLPTIDQPVDAGSAWVAEGDTGPSLEPSTRLATLQPKTMIYQVTVSRRLMMQTGFDLERALRAELLRNTMRAIDYAALAGAGADAPPGLLNDPDLDVLSAGANGAAPTWAHIVDLEHEASNRAGNMVAPAFLTSPAIRKRLRLTQRAPGLDFILSDTATTLLGQPLRISAQVPVDLTKGTSVENCSAMVFGDWAEVVVGFWGPAAIDVLVDAVTGAHRGQIKLTCRAEVGVAVRDIRAFSAFKDLWVTV